MNIDADKFMFPWREYEHCWRHQRRVGDCFHVISGRFLEDFKDVLAKFEEDGMFHLIYDPLANKIGRHNISFVEMGYYDSNSGVMKNPIYDIIRL